MSVTQATQVVACDAKADGFLLDVFHRIGVMAFCRMVLMLAVTGLSHRQSYKDIFAIIIIKTLAVFVVIGVYYATGLV